MNVFEEIYKNNSWGFGSGHGSLPAVTKGYCRFIQDFMRINEIKSVVDYGCGDWQFSRFINWQGIDYIGLEIVPDLVEKNNQLYGKKNIRFVFSPSDLSKLPEADLLLVKDVLQHLSENQIKEFIDKALPRYHFALITNGVEPLELLNRDIKTGRFRPLDLRKSPFYLDAAAVYTFGRKRRTFSIKEWKFFKPWQRIVLLYQNKNYHR